MSDYVAVHLHMDSLRLSLNADGTLLSFAGNGSTRFVHIQLPKDDAERLNKAVEAFNREMRPAYSFKIVEG